MIVVISGGDRFPDMRSVSAVTSSILILGSAGTISSLLSSSDSDIDESVLLDKRLGG